MVIKIIKKKEKNKINFYNFIIIIIIYKMKVKWDTMTLDLNI